MSSVSVRRSRVRMAVAGVLVLALAACGGDGTAETAPQRVPLALVPDRLLDDSLGVFENTDESTKEALANTDPSSLVADTRVWEIRRGDRLVGTLQLSTMVPKVDLTDVDVRDDLVAGIIVGQQSRIRVGDVEVFTRTSDDKSVYLWFGAELFAVVQTKARELDPDALVSDLIAYQSVQEEWEPLPELLEFEE